MFANLWLAPIGVMQQLWFTRILNGLLAAPVAAVLQAIGVHPSHPQAPISDSVAIEIFVALVLMVFGLWLRGRLSVDKPRGWQHILEMGWLGLGDHGEEVIGHGAARFQGFLFTLFFFILVANLIGLIPGFVAPTSDIHVTLGLAVISFVYYHAVGIRRHGLLRYLKQFLGPIPVLAPLMIPVEIISHFARILSLSVRLYANMFAGELVTTIFVALLPITGVLFMGLHVFVAVLQAYIFLVLTMIYLGGALAEEH